MHSTRLHLSLGPQPQGIDVAAAVSVTAEHYLLTTLKHDFGLAGFRQYMPLLHS